MVDPDIFLTTPYMLVDDFSKAKLSSENSSGPNASLTRSDVVIRADWY